MLLVRIEEGNNEREEENAFLTKNVKVRDHLEDPSQDGRMILKWIVRFWARIDLG
jgi:hypothetical protein